MNNDHIIEVLEIIFQGFVRLYGIYIACWLTEFLPALLHLVKHYGG